jgi:hypothetical protein
MERWLFRSRGYPRAVLPEAQMVPQELMPLQAQAIYQPSMSKPGQTAGQITLTLLLALGCLSLRSDSAARHDSNSRMRQEGLSRPQPGHQESWKSEQGE